MDGMADFNTPAPQMGSDMPMEDPMMGEDPNMGDPNAMGDQDMGMDGNQDDDELMNIIGNLSVEDKAAVLKYAKSMAEDNPETAPSEELPADPNQMPESRELVGGIVDETINSTKGKRETGMKRPEKGLSDKYNGKKRNPFVSPY